MSLPRDDYLTRAAERREQVRRMTLQGASTRQIAEALGTSTRTITRTRVKLGISQAPLPRMTDAQKAEALRLLDDGCSATETARTVGVSIHSILKHFPGRGWTRQQGAAWGLFMRHTNEKLRKTA